MRIHDALPRLSDRFVCESTPCKRLLVCEGVLVVLPFFLLPAESSQDIMGPLLLLSCLVVCARAVAPAPAQEPAAAADEAPVPARFVARLVYNPGTPYVVSRRWCLAAHRAHHSDRQNKASTVVLSLTHHAGTSCLSPCSISSRRQSACLLFCLFILFVLNDARAKFFQFSLTKFQCAKLLVLNNNGEKITPCASSSTTGVTSTR